MVMCLSVLPPLGDCSSSLLLGETFRCCCCCCRGIGAGGGDGSSDGGVMGAWDGGGAYLGVLEWKKDRMESWAGFMVGRDMMAERETETETDGETAKTGEPS